MTVLTRQLALDILSERGVPASQVRALTVRWGPGAGSPPEVTVELVPQPEEL